MFTFLKDVDVEIGLYERNNRWKLGRNTEKKTVSGKIEMARDFSVIIDPHFWKWLKNDNDDDDEWFTSPVHDWFLTEFTAKIITIFTEWRIIQNNMSEKYLMIDLFINFVPGRVSPLFKSD